MDAKGTVYFLQPGEIQKVKIGFTFDLIARIRALQTGSCEILKLAGTIPNASPALELSIHQKFKAYRLHNEWFSFSEEIREFLARKAKFPAYDHVGNWIGNFPSEDEAKAASKVRFAELFGQELADQVEVFQ